MKLVVGAQLLDPLASLFEPEKTTPLIRVCNYVFMGIQLNSLKDLMKIPLKIKQCIP